jgi:hypothetical protein
MIITIMMRVFVGSCGGCDLLCIQFSTVQAELVETVFIFILQQQAAGQVV